MKNKRHEAWRKSAKREFNSRLYTRNWDPVRQIKIFHCYDEPRDLSYWDDVSIKWGSKYVLIAWTHPRYLYADAQDQKAREYAESLTSRKRRSVDAWWLYEATKNWKKVGKSRKKVESYTLPHDDSAEGKSWQDLRLAKADELLYNDTTFRHGTYFRFSQESWGMMLSVCCPVEVRNEDELQAMADLMREILDGRKSFAEMFGDYTYGCDDYTREFPKDSPDGNI